MKRSIALVAAVLAFAAVPSFAASSKLTGYISDAMCGAKHAGTGMACAKKCLQGGEAPVFVDASNKTVYKIDNPDAVKPFWGEKVAVSATVDTSAKSVHIDNIAAAK